MKIQAQVRQLAYRQGILLEKAIPVSDVESFLARFREKYVPIDLIRIGGDGDGGYLLPDNLNLVKYCFSPGVDYTAKFESELSRIYGITSYMADASVPSAPIVDENIHFVPKFLGSRTYGKFITLSDWVKDCVGESDADRILQMDIEGGEYDVLAYESADFLAQFSSMIIEFHDVHNLFQRQFFRSFSAIFEKIFQNFSICHVHPNNCCGIATFNGIGSPKVIEVTFIRNDLIDRFTTDAEIDLPHPLDCKNVVALPDIELPAAWWKK